MNKQIKIYDPINMRIHCLNFNEIRLWVDVFTLQKTIESSIEYQNRFQELEPDKKERLLSFIDKYEQPPKFQIAKIKTIPGIEITFDARVLYQSDSVKFQDTTKLSMMDNFFYNKKLYTQNIEASLYVEQYYFPLKSICAITQDFYTMKPIELNSTLPVFERFIGNDSDGDIKLMLDSNSNVCPISVYTQVFRDDYWSFEVMATVKTTVDWTNILYPNIPNIRKVYEFFNKEGFSPKGDGIKLVRFERDDDIVEYIKSNPHYYKPFLLIKQAGNKSDIKSKEILGIELKEKMIKTGLFEDITFFRANHALNEGVDKLTTKKKSAALPSLDNALVDLNNCTEHLWEDAQIETIFTLWVKSRIYNLYNDTDKKIESYKLIINKFIELRAWDELIVFLNTIYKEKDVPYNLIGTILPTSLLNKNVFMTKEVFSNLLDYWDKAQTTLKCPKDVELSRWHYALSREAQDIGLYKIAKSRLKKFFKETLKNPNKTMWAMNGTEELLEFAINTNTEKEYLKFSKKMAEIFALSRKKQNIADMSTEGRKNYRWNSFVSCVAESRWSYHAGHIMMKSKNQNLKEINKLFNQSYEAFTESLLHYDVSENYNQEQLKTIAHSFISSYNLAYTMLDEEFMNYIKDLILELWEKHFSPELYHIINIVFSFEERSEMADFIVNYWIEEENKAKGSFQLDIKNTLDLSQLYLSVNEYEECAKTLKTGLSKNKWDFKNLEKAYKIYSEIFFISPDYSSICEDELFKWIDFYCSQTFGIKEKMTDLFSRMNQTTNL